MFKSAADVALLKEGEMSKLAADKDALVPALVMVALAALVTALGYAIFPMHSGMYVVYRPDFLWVLEKVVWTFALNVAALYLVGYLAVQLFKSKLDMEGFVRLMGHGMIVSLFSIIPSLGFVSGIWSLVILWKVLHELGKLDLVEVIILLVIAVIVVGALGFSGVFL